MTNKKDSKEKTFKNIVDALINVTNTIERQIVKLGDTEDILKKIEETIYDSTEKLDNIIGELFDLSEE